MSKSWVCRSEQIIRIWSWAGGVRCVLQLCQGALELRLESGNSVLKRAVYFDARHAIDQERAWRVQFEMEVDRPDSLAEDERCSECADGAVVELDPATGIEWLRCPSCGNVEIQNQHRDWVRHDLLPCRRDR